MTNQVTAIDRMKTLSMDHSETIMKSTQIWFGGCQSIIHSLAIETHARCELGWSNWIALAKAKSINEALQIQVSQAHSAIQRNLDGSTRLSQASVKLMENTMAPITAIMSRSIESDTAAAE